MTKRGVRTMMLAGLGRMMAGTAMVVVLAGVAQAAPAVSASFDIAAQPLGAALAAFGARTGISVSYGTTLPSVNSPGAKGEMAPAEALSQLLSGTGLTYRFTAPNAVVLDVAPTADAGTVQLGAVKVAADEQAPSPSGDIPTPKTDRAATDRSHSYAARAATVAGKTAQPLREIPQSVTVLTRQRLDDQNIVSIEDALRQTTGVTAVPYGDGTAYFQVRGYPAQVEYDGIPANDGIQYLGQYDLAMYDRIEVLRGPSGLLQGSGEPAGTVNLVRKRPHDEFGWAGSLMGGSWNNFHGDIDVTGPLDSGGSIRGRVVVAGQDRDFFYDKAHEKHVLLYGILEFDLGASTTLTVSGTFEDQKAAPYDYGQSLYANGTFLNAPRSSFFGVPWASGPTHNREAYASLDHDFGNGWAAKASIDYRRQRITGEYGYIDGFVNLDNSADYALQSQYVLNKWIGVDANVSGPLRLFGRTHTLLFGANYAWRDNVSLSGYTGTFVDNVYDIDIPKQAIPFDFGSDTRSEQYGAYAQGRFSLADPLTLVLGGRITHYDAKTRTGVENFGAFSGTLHDSGHFTPSAGIVYDVTRQISLYGSYASIFVPQSNLVFEGGTLKPRTGEQFEVGAKGSFLNGALTASAALFSLTDRNRAYDDPAHPNYYIAAGKVRSRGAEAEISGEPLPGWSVFAGYTYLKTKFLDDAANQGAIFDSEEPKNTFKLWSAYRFGPIDQRGFQIGGGVRVLSSTNRGGPDQPTYAVADAQVGYRLNGQWSATLSVNNLFDKTYYARVPSSYFGIYGDPRSFTVALRKGF